MLGLSSRSATPPASPAEGMPEISVVVPVYYAAACVDELVRRLHLALASISAHYEVLLVDDGSADDSWARIQEAAQADKRMVGVRLSRNFGQHYAISAGIDLARGNWVVVMDCDLQDPPEVIPALYAKAQEGHRVVFARQQVSQASFGDRITSRAFYLSLGLISKIKVEQGLTNFSIASRQVSDVVRSMRDRLRFYGGMLFWAGFPYAVIDYARAERFSGTSNYNFWRRLRLAVKNVFAYSTVPLEYCTYVGLGVMVLAAAYGVYAVAGYFLHSSIPSGWTSLALLVVFFGGFLAFQLGLIGLYVGQIMEESRRRPLYVIAESTVPHLITSVAA